MAKCRINLYDICHTLELRFIAESDGHTLQLGTNPNDHFDNVKPLKRSQSSLVPNETIIIMIMSGAIYGFAQSADRAARFADPHIEQLIGRSRSYRKIAQA